MRRPTNSSTVLFLFKSSDNLIFFNNRALITSLLFIAIAFWGERSAESRNRTENYTLSEIAPIQSVDTNAGEITLKTLASVQKPHSLEPFILSIELECPSDYTTSPNDLTGTYGDFYLTPLKEVKTENREKSTKILTRSWQVYPNNRGTAALPPIPLSLKSNDRQQSPVYIQTPPLTFEIPTIEVHGTVDDIHADYSPIKPFPVLQCVIVALCAMFAIACLVLKRKKVGKEIKEIASEQIQEDPYKKAVHRLDELKSSRLYFENKEDFYLVIASILRSYLAERFTLNAEESTTQEVLKTIDSYHFSNDSTSTVSNSEEGASENISPAQYEAFAYDALKEKNVRSSLESSLFAIDLVKFARQPTTFDDASRLFEQIRNLIDEAERLLNERLERLKSILMSKERQNLSTETASSQSND